MVTFLDSLSQFGTTYTDLGPEERKSLNGRQMLCAGVKALQAGVKGPCLHRSENWLIRQLNDEPKLIYKKWDLLERKERLQLEKCSRAQKPVTCCTDEAWGFL
jgi:hypothetical protein